MDNSTIVLAQTANAIGFGLRLASGFWYRRGIGARPVLRGVVGLYPSSRLAQAHALFQPRGRVQRHIEAKLSGGSMTLVGDASISGDTGDVTIHHCCVAHILATAVAGDILQLLPMGHHLGVSPLDLGAQDS